MAIKSLWTRLVGRRENAVAKSPRRRVPTILQMEGVECGAAALAMVMAHHGRHEPLEKLRVACGVSRDGSKATNLLKAARSYGLLAKGYKKEVDGLRSMPMPQIIFWNFNHYLVLEGFGKNKVYLNNPASGQETVNLEEFTQSYTGVTMVFEAGPEFVRNRRRSPWRSLKERLPGIRLGLVFLLLATFALVIPGLVIPAFSRIFFDNVLTENQVHWFRPLMLAIAATAVVRGLLTWMQQLALQQLEGRLSVTGSGQFFWHVLRLPIEFFTQRYAGDVTARVEINYRLASLLCSDLATNFVNGMVAIFYAILLYQYDAWLAALGVALAGVNLAVLRVLNHRQKEMNRRLQQSRGKLVGASMAGLYMIETYKACGAEDDFFHSWAGYQARTLNAVQQIGPGQNLLLEVPALLSALTSAAILWVGGIRVLDGALTLGALVAVQALMTLFQEPVNQLTQLGGKLQQAEADINRIEDVLHYPATEIADSADSEETKLKGSLELRGVTFGYSRLEPPLIEGLNLHLRPGDRVALVGASGSGKSTVAKLVCGLYHPWEGEILFDGRPRNQIGHAALARSLACVDQDLILFEGSARDNLTLWDDSVDEDIVVRAAQDACIYDDIVKLPGGFNGILQEGGRNLSGGQRQRMEIARSLVTEPRILILDEATSALDPVTEKEIEDALRRRACTCLIVAHRLSTIRDCDEILVLDRGRVVERGTHDSLLTEGGYYARLFETE